MSSPLIEPELDRIVAETIQRRGAGESLSDAEVLSAHPQLADQLQIKLRQLQLIANARKRADDACFEKTFLQDSVDAGDSSTLIYCPGCESRWNRSSGLTPETDLCPTCGVPLKPLEGEGPHVGQQIRHYLLVEQVGTGGFGTVWRARDAKLECDVAIKIPRNEKLSTDLIERFIQEARVSAHLRQHPNIVSVHEADWDNETAFIASDFIEGISLGDRLKLEKVPREQVVDLVITICGALHHAHEAGIIHRDLKPDNILLDSHDVPHVTDFGLAKQENQSVIREVGRIMGTASYMSPEQASGSSEKADRRSDVFSLGVILYEMLTTERPFRGNIPRILRQILDEDPPKLRDFDSTIPIDLETICLKCLEKDPDLRYQTMKELQSDLQRFQKHQPIHARPISTVGRLWRWCKRNPVIPWLSLALILVTIGATISAGILLDRQVATMQDEMLGEMQGVFETLAFHATEDADLTLKEGFDAVGDMSRDKGDKSISQLLTTWNERNDVKKQDLRAQLRNEAESRENSDEIVFPEEMYPMQSSLRERVKSIDSRLAMFSAFVCDAEGFQIARVEEKETLGKRYHYRSYFTGGKEYPKDTRPDQIENADSNWKGPTPRLSEVFVTDTGDACVIAISAPVRNEKGEFQGVVGIFVELGKLIEFPSSIAENNSCKINMGIYDARPRHGQKGALVIHHPSLSPYLKEQLHRDQTEENGTPADKLLPTVDLELDGAQDSTSKFTRLQNYQDPLGEPDQPEPWLAIRSNEPIYEGLYVVVQMPMSAIEAPGKHLLANLIVLGLAVVGFSAAILIPMWLIILHRVIQD